MHSSQCVCLLVRRHAHKGRPGGLYSVHGFSAAAAAAAATTDVPYCHAYRFVVLRNSESVKIIGKVFDVWRNTSNKPTRPPSIGRRIKQTNWCSAYSRMRVYVVAVDKYCVCFMPPWLIEQYWIASEHGICDRKYWFRKSITVKNKLLHRRIFVGALSMWWIMRVNNIWTSILERWRYFLCIANMQIWGQKIQKYTHWPSIDHLSGEEASELDWQ